MATPAVNVAGSAALGFVLGASPRLAPIVVTTRGVGFLGAFTAFSTFSAGRGQRGNVTSVP